MWRYDHNRSASTPEQLADKLYLQWEVTYSARTPVWDDPLNQNLMPIDNIFEPIVTGNKIFLGFNDQDKIVALDLASGKELWSYYAEGPVRLPMAANKGKVYFISDDGFCYCLNAETGDEVWRTMGGEGPAIAGGNGTLYIGTYKGEIEVYDEATEKLVETIKLKTIPRSITPSPDRTRFYALDSRFEQIEIIDIATRKSIDTFKLTTGNKNILTVDLMKRMKDKAFARQVKREDIVKGAEELGADLNEHIAFVIQAMRGVADDLGLRGTL